jgi:hypothetical protein
MDMCKAYITRQQMFWPNGNRFKCEIVTQMLRNAFPEIRKETEYEEKYCQILIGLHIRFPGLTLKMVLN